MLMPFIELQSAIKPLPRLKKLRLMEWIIADMTRKETVLTLKSGESYRIWSPYDAYDAADILRHELIKEKRRDADEKTTISIC